MLLKKQYNHYYSLYYNDVDRLINLSESVIHVDKYVNNLIYLLKEIKQHIFDTEDLYKKIDYLNSIFITYKIKFIIQDEYKLSGFIKGITNKENITIFISYNISELLDNDIQYKFFIQRAITLIGHELVHRGQYYIRKADFINFYAYENNSDLNYYSRSQEIMAYAWMGIENMRFNGYKDTQILSKIKSNNISPAEMGVAYLYISDMRERDKKVYNRFLKYMYDYLVNPIVHDLKIEI